MVGSARTRGRESGRQQLVAARHRIRPVNEPVGVAQELVLQRAHAGPGVLREEPPADLERRAQRLDAQVLRAGVVHVTDRQPLPPAFLPHGQQRLDQREAAVGFDADHARSIGPGEREQLADHLQRRAACDPRAQHVTGAARAVRADGHQRPGASARTLRDGRVQEGHHVQPGGVHVLRPVGAEPGGLERLARVVGTQRVVAQPVAQADGGAHAGKRLIAEPLRPDAAPLLRGGLHEQPRQRAAGAVLHLDQPPGALHHAARAEHRAQHREGEPSRFHRRHHLVHQPVPQVLLAVGVARQLGVLQVVAHELGGAVLAMAASARAHPDPERLEPGRMARGRPGQRPSGLRSDDLDLPVVAADAGIVLQLQAHVVHVLRGELLHLAAVDQVGGAALQRLAHGARQRQQHALARAAERAHERRHSRLARRVHHAAVEGGELAVEVVRQVGAAPPEQVQALPGLTRVLVQRIEGRAEPPDPLEQLLSPHAMLSRPTRHCLIVLVLGRKSLFVTG